VTGREGISRRDLFFGAGALAGAALLDACSSSAKGASASTTTGGTAASTAASATTSAAPGTSSGTSAGEVASTTAVAAAGTAARYVSKGPTNGDAVAVTFHFDGQSALVKHLLDVMKDEQLHATFFAIGKWITANPKLTRRAIADGHELGNHTEHHLSMLTLGRKQVRAEIVDGGKALTPYIGSIGKWFRPSGTDVPNQIILDEAGKAGYPVSVGYDVNSLDYKEVGAKKVIDTVKRGVGPGSIVSMHFGHQDTIDALPTILDYLRTNNLRPVTVSELLG
jgi:hypothetical protein